MKPLPLFILFIFATSDLAGQDWSAFRGADGSGAAIPTGVLSGNEPVGLKVRWKVKLGSGYSSIVTSGDHVVTMYCDDEKDYVVCLDASDGAIRWKTAVGEKFVGENGSFDGPISTPLVVDGRVIALDPSGTLVCLQLDDGSEVWSKELVAELGAAVPMYGFATSPIAVGDCVCIQSGVKDGSVAAIELADGKIRWTATGDKIDSQTPVATTINGQDVVLAAGGRSLFGVDAKSGEVLFEYPHNGGNGSAMVPVVLPEDNVLLTLDDSYSKTLSLKATDSKQINVSEKWQQRTIKNTYNVPVYCNENLFAYSTRILTCVDPDTGRARWKSRKPGDGFLIAVGNHLIINTKKGSLHLAKASNEKYDELANLKLFDDLVWSLPAFADNAVFCRSLGEVACVDVVGSEARISSDVAEGLPLGSQFQTVLAQVKTAGAPAEQQRIIDRFLQSKDRFPIIENDIVHFVYQGDVKDVAVAGDMFGSRQEKSMRRIEETDVFFYSVRLAKDQRANYVFLVNYVPQTDPKNERRFTSSVYAGEMEFAVRLRNEKPLELSWFAMPQWQQPSYLTDLDASVTGTFVEHKIGESTVAEVYLPEGYADSDDRLGVVYVFTDPTHKTIGRLVPAVDKLVAQDEKLKPVIMVFPRISPFGPPAFSVASQLIPSVDKQYRTLASRESRWSVGFGIMATAALKPAMENPELIGSASAYSPLIFESELRQLENAIGNLSLETRVYLEWGRFDMFNPHENWDIRKVGQQLFDKCKQNNKIRVSGGMVNDSTDWSSWRNRYDRIFFD